MKRQKLQEDSSQANQHDVDLLTVARLIIKRKYWVIGLVIVAMGVTSILMLMTPNRYTSTARIFPSSEMNALLSLTRLFEESGLVLPIAENSSVLFPMILKTDYILNGVIDRRYQFAFEGIEHDMSLADYFKQRDPNELRGALRSMISVSMDKNTKVVKISVETIYPELSQEIVQELLHQLDAYNLQNRHSKGKEYAEYLKAQLESCRLKLTNAEDSLEHFRRNNKDWATTTKPEILTRLVRLDREVELQSTTYKYLNQQYEIAKLEEQKDIPIIRILDQPSLPVTKSGPFRKLVVTVVGILTCVMVVIFFVMIDLARMNRR